MTHILLYSTLLLLSACSPLPNARITTEASSDPLSSSIYYKLQHSLRLPPDYSAHIKEFRNIGDSPVNQITRLNYQLTTEQYIVEITLTTPHTHCTETWDIHHDIIKASNVLYSDPVSTVSVVDTLIPKIQLWLNKGCIQ